MLYEISGALLSNGDIKLMAQKSQNYSIYYLLYGVKKMPRPSMLYEISGALPSNGDIKLMAQFRSYMAPRPSMLYLKFLERRLLTVTSNKWQKSQNFSIH